MKTNNKYPAGKRFDSKETRLLAAIGFMSARAGLSMHASQIFEGLSANQQKKPFIYIGLAMSELCIGQYDRAVSILRDQGLIAFPDDEQLSAWLAIALYYSGRLSSALKIAEALRCQNADGNFKGVFEKIFGKNSKQGIAEPAFSYAGFAPAAGS